MLTESSLSSGEVSPSPSQTEEPVTEAGLTPLQEVAVDRLEMDNLYSLQTIQAINRDHRKADQNWEDARKRYHRDQPARNPLEEQGAAPQPTTEAEGSGMPEDDTVNWKTTENHYHPAPPQPAEPKQSLLRENAGKLLLAGTLLGTGGIGTAGVLGYQAIKAISQQKDSQVDVKDGTMSIRFVGGEPVDPQD